MTPETMQELQATLTHLKLTCLAVQFVAVAFIGGSIAYLIKEATKAIIKRL